MNMTQQLHDNVKALANVVGASPPPCTVVTSHPKTLVEVPFVLSCAMHHVDSIRSGTMKGGGQRPGSASSARGSARKSNAQVDMVWKCVVLRRQIHRLQTLARSPLLPTRRFIDRKLKVLHDELTRTLARRGEMANHNNVRKAASTPTPTRPPTTPQPSSTSVHHVNINEQFMYLRRPKTPNPTPSNTGPAHPQTSSSKAKTKFNEVSARAAALHFDAHTSGSMYTGTQSAAVKERPSFVQSVLQHLPRYADHSSSLASGNNNNNSRGKSDDVPKSKK
eukprot:PhF_6_TR4435/c0_g1_i1/m.6004